jgi:hypothetical protein
LKRWEENKNRKDKIYYYNYSIKKEKYSIEPIDSFQKVR